MKTSIQKRTRLTNLTTFKVSHIAISMALVTMFVAGCARVENTIATPTPVQPVTLVDSLGREVTIATPPKRIISLAASNTEIIFAIGAGDRLVGRDDYSDYPADVVNVESIGSLYPHVNAEVIVALEPNLVLAAGITNPEDVAALDKLGLTVYTTSVASSFNEIYADILAIGTLTGENSGAETVVKNMKDRVQAVAELTKNVSHRPTVFYEIDATDPYKPWTSGPGSFIDILITTAGGDNVGASSEKAYWQISVEELVEQDPQIIVLGSSKYSGQTPELVSQRPGWGQISAVTTANVHPFDDDLVSRPGPRLVEGLETLAKIIHPKIFE